MIMSFRGRGVGVMMGSSLVFSAMSGLVRLAKEVPGVSTFHTAFFRFLVGVCCVIVYWGVRRERVRWVNRGWLGVRGVVGGAAVLFYFEGIVRVGLAKGTLLNYTYPLWATAMAPFFLGERVGTKMWVALGGAFIGLYFLIVPPSGLGEMTLDDGVALFGGFLAGIAVVAIKRLRETDSSWTIFFSQSAFGLLMVSYGTVRSSFDFPWEGWAICLGIGLVATVGQLMMTYAYKYVGGAEGSLLSLLTPVVNALVGVGLFGEPWTLRTLFGGGLILIACVYVAIPFSMGESLTIIRGSVRYNRR